MEETKEQVQPADPQEHVLHVWEPLSFVTPKNYDYTRRSALKSVWTFLLRTAVVHLLAVYDHLALGFVLRGRENLRLLGEQGAVTVCNHLHPLDCTMVTVALYPRRHYTLTLESNFRIPLVRHLIRWLDAVPLPEQPRRLGEMMRAVGGAAREGTLIHIYPEAILLPYCDHLRAFHPGAFRLAAANGLPVLPMVIRQVPPHGLYRLYKRRPCLELEILPPIVCPQAGTTRERAQALCEQSFDAMQAAMTAGDGQNASWR